MKNLTSSLFCCLLCLLFCIAMISCEEDEGTSSPFVGKWEHTEINYSTGKESVHHWTFEKGGKCIHERFTSTGTSYKQYGQWSYSDMSSMLETTIGTNDWIITSITRDFWTGYSPKDDYKSVIFYRLE